MAATQITVCKTARTSSSANLLQFAQADTLNGNSFLNDGSTWLVLDNKEASQGSNPVTVTITPAGKADLDLTIANRVFTLNAGDVIAAGPFDRDIFNQPDGTVSFQASAALPVVALTIIQ